MAQRKTLKNQSYSYARPWHVNKFTYIVTLWRFIVSVHAQAKVMKLSCRARRVLAFYFALYRCDKVGFVGTACTLDQLSEAVIRCTLERCGVSTLKLAIKELIKAGILTACPWVPDNAKAINIAPAGESPTWRSRQIRIYSLTPAALELLKGGEVSDKNLRSQKLATAPRSDISLFLKENIETRASDEKTGVSSSKGASNESPTGDMPTQAPGALLEHRTIEAGTSALENRPKGGGAVSRQGPSAPTPNRLPRNAPKTRTNARQKLLRDLWHMLRGHPSTKANYIFNRAKNETDPRRPGEFGTAANWDYCLNNWLDWPHEHRRYTIRAEILPALQRAPLPAVGDSKAAIGMKDGRIQVQERPAPAPDSPVGIPANIATPEIIEKLTPEIRKFCLRMAQKHIAAGDHDAAKPFLIRLKKKL